MAWVEGILTGVGAAIVVEVGRHGRALVCSRRRPLTGDCLVVTWDPEDQDALFSIEFSRARQRGDFVSGEWWRVWPTHWHRHWQFSGYYVPHEAYVSLSYHALDSEAKTWDQFGRNGIMDLRVLAGSIQSGTFRTSKPLDDGKEVSHRRWEAPVVWYPATSPEARPLWDLIARESNLDAIQNRVRPRRVFRRIESCARRSDHPASWTEGMAHVAGIFDRTAPNAFVGERLRRESASNEESGD
jgi:hypothetical protein